MSNNGNGLKPHALGKVHQAALAMAGGSRHTPTAAELRLARHMAQNGAKLREILEALGWDMTVGGLGAKLRKYNIRSRVRANGKVGSHFGGTTHYPHEDSTKMQSYRPR